MKQIDWKNALWYRLLKYSTYVLSDRSFLKFQYRYRTGRTLNLEDPRTFTEKINWLKLNCKRAEFTYMVDKATAKDYVASIIGEEYIIPTIGIWDSADAIDWDSLPQRFVVKPTNDSGSIVICKDKSHLDVDSALKRLKKKSKRNYSRFSKEYPYEKVPRRFICEEYIEDGGSDLTDYKFFCFGGRARYCQVIANRTKEETIDFYDREWRHQPFIGLFPLAHHAPSPHHAPINYGKMLELVDEISSKIETPFVRIDLYNLQGRIFFGEITFFPLSGMGVFRPAEWDNILGDMISLPSAS